MSEKPAVIDTNVLVFDTFEDSEKHADSKRLLDTLPEWIIPAIVIHEYVWVLKGLDMPLAFLREKISEYLFNEKTSFHPTTLSTLNYAIKEMGDIGDYNDYLILATAINANRPLATFDKKLSSKARKLGLTITP